MVAEVFRTGLTQFSQQMSAFKTELTLMYRQVLKKDRDIYFSPPPGAKSQNSDFV